MPPPLESHSEFTGKASTSHRGGNTKKKKEDNLFTTDEDNGHENTSDSRAGTNDNLC